jgi:hypothetical protein
MQLARFVGTFGLALALVVAGFAVGCGSDQGSAGVSKEVGKTIREQRKEGHQRLLGGDNEANTGKPGRGKNRGPTGP